MTHLLLIEPSIRHSKEPILKSFTKVPNLTLYIAYGLSDIFDYSWTEKYSHHHFAFSYQDPSAIDRIIHWLQTLKVQLDGVFTLAEPSVNFTNQLAHKLHLPPISRSKTFRMTDKYTVRNKIKGYKKANPKFWIAENEKELLLIRKQISYPIVVKPAEMTASLGVSVVRRSTQLRSAYDKARAADFIEEDFRSHFPNISEAVLLEAYVPGQEYSAEIAVIAGKPTLLGVTKKFTTTGVFRDEVGHTFPTILSTQKQKHLIDFIFFLCKALEWENTFAHIEFKFSGNEPVLMEANSRTGGDLITSLISSHFGIPFAEVLTAIHTNRALPKLKGKDQFSIFFYGTTEEGRVLKIPENPKKSKLKLESKIYVKRGDLLFRQGLLAESRLGHIMTKGTLRVPNPLKTLLQPAISLVPYRNSKDKFALFEARVSDLDILTKMESAAWSKEQLANRIRLKKRLQGSGNRAFIGYSVKENRPVGFITFVRVPKNLPAESNWYTIAQFAESTGKAKSTHSSKTWHILTISVPPQSPKYTGTHLVKTAIDFMLSSKGTVIRSGMRIPGFGKLASQGIAIEQYLQLLHQDKAWEPLVRIVKSTGGSLKAIIPNYWKDPDSHNYSLLTEWKNKTC